MNIEPFAVSIIISCKIPDYLPLDKAAQMVINLAYGQD